MSQAEGKAPVSLQAGSTVSGEAVGKIAQPVERLQILHTNDSCRFVDERTKSVGKSVRGGDKKSKLILRAGAGT